LVRLDISLEATVKNHRYISLALLLFGLVVLTAVVIMSIQFYAEGQIMIIELNDGLEAVIDPIEHGSDIDINVTLTLYNRGEKTFYLAHIGPAKVQDSTDGDYECIYTSEGGHIELGDIANISQWSNYGDQDKIKKIQEFTRIAPKTHSNSILFTFRKKNGKSKGSHVSFSTVLAARSVDNSIADKTLGEDKKIRDVYLMNVDFRLVRVHKLPPKLW
jgi:hypothetical protein